MGLTEIAEDYLLDRRTGRNILHHLVPLLRQSIFSRLAGYDDTNDADRLAYDPAMRVVVGWQGSERKAASTSEMGRFETETLTKEKNLKGLARMNSQWVEGAMVHTPHRRVILDMDSSESPVHGQQEGAAYNGHFECVCYHPLFLFNQFGDCEAAKLRSGNVHSADDWQAQMPEVERLCRFSRIGAGDPLYSHVQSKLGAIRRLAEARPSSPTAYRLMLRILPLKYSRGRQGDWNVDPQTGDNACSALKSLLKELDDATSGEIAQARRAVFTPVLDGLREFALNYARQRRAEGRAEFHDLLAWAHELLRGNLEVRDHFRRRFSHLLIDEAQDTDPIQAEIAMFLAEHVPEGQPATSRPTAWELITPEKGKLFVVGDPKQSIYRFRRADVAQMKRLQQRMEEAGGRTVSLVQNFRSQKRLIAWLNRLFEQWKGEDGNEGGGLSRRRPVARPEIPTP